MADDRLSALDATFLQGEDEDTNTTVGGVEVFVGAPPSFEEFRESIEGRLDDLTNFRRKLATVPLGLGRPRWVDDEAFDLDYHLRHTALPSPGGAAQLQDLLGRLFGQHMSRDRPLWELWLVEGLADGRFAMVHRMHHALVDGIASINVLETLLDAEPVPADASDTDEWRPQPGPSTVRLLADAAFERAMPPELARSLFQAVKSPRRTAGDAVRTVAGAAGLARAAATPAPPSPYNAPVGPHRRLSWQRESLDDLKAMKNALSGSLNDVVLAGVAGALGRHLRRRGEDTAGMELFAFVPVSVRGGDDDAGGNEVSGLKVPLPVGVEEPGERFRRVHEAMDELKESAQVDGAKALIEATGLAPHGVLERLSGVASLQRFVNLVVTNVPGPQQALYLQGRPLEDIFPFVPLGGNLGLGVVIVSYLDRIAFGFSGDPDIVPDLDHLPGDLHASFAELAELTGAELTEPAPEGTSVGGAGEPWPGYDEQTLGQLRPQIARLDAEGLARVRRYERANKDRAGVRQAVERNRS